MKTAFQTVDIAHRDDERIAAYRDVRERDLVGRKGLFIAEGKVVLQVLLDAPAFDVESVLVLQRRLAGVATLLADRPGLPIYVAGDEVMEEIAGFHVHRGILALGRPRQAQTAGTLIEALPDKALVVVCVGISNHDNIGSIFRNAAAFGAAAVLLDETCCDPLYRKAIRVSVGGVLKVPFARFDGWQALTAKLGEAGFNQFALTPRGSLNIVDVHPGKRAAIFLGTEGEGLPGEMIDGITAVRIPISPGFDSLNVAAASAIALHRLSSGLA